MTASLEEERMRRFRRVGGDVKVCHGQIGFLDC